jgi:perosamine synthetase
MKKLKDRQIETRPFFIPMNKQPVFQDLGFFRGETFPIATDLSRKGLHLPSSSGLKATEIQYIYNMIKEIARLE